MRRTAALALLLACLATSADAHPVDEVVQGAYLLLAPGQVRLELDVPPGPEVVAPLLRDMDADGDHAFSAAEKRAYALRVLRLCTLEIGGRAVAWRFDEIGAPPYGQLAGQATTIQIFATASDRGGEGPRPLRFSNGYRPARGPTTANVFAKRDGAFGYVFEGQRRSDDGRDFAVVFRRARIGAPRGGLPGGDGHA